MLWKWIQGRQCRRQPVTFACRKPLSYGNVLSALASDSRLPKPPIVINPSSSCGRRKYLIYNDLIYRQKVIIAPSLLKGEGVQSTKFELSREEGGKGKGGDTTRPVKCSSSSSPCLIIFWTPDIIADSELVLRRDVQFAVFFKYFAVLRNLR